MPTSDDRDIKRRRKESANDLARVARTNAAAFSRRIPGATKVREYKEYTEVVTLGNEAPNAAPFEEPLRHPDFGSRTSRSKGARTRYEDDDWYLQPHRPFMQRAFDAKAEEGADHIADVVDDWGDEFGFKQE